ncbi:MAG: hypothetical protein KJO40_13690 [Deltaproteobacteria bacterium]|nr:hypothetical protein [Deltaproteobacteria bacterium]
MRTTRLGKRIAQIPKEVARALPSSKQGETPGALQFASTQLYTYFTQIGGTRLIYSADRWVTVRLTLETAGPVDVGTAANIEPVLSGRGRSLVTGVEFTTKLAKGTRLYITSQSINRVLVTIEPIPWLQQISDEIVGVGQGIIAAINALRRPAMPSSSAGTPADEIPCPPPQRRFLPKLKRGRR